MLISDKVDEMPGSGGRPVDGIWEHFERNGNKSKCIICGHEAAANPERMKKHYSKHGESREAGPSRPKQ